MKYLEIPPPPRLRPYIQLIWCLELDVPGEFGPPERIAPDGILELVFHYRDPLRLRYAGEAFAPQPRSSVVSQTRRFIEIAPRGSVGFISVRFWPWGAYHFLREPLSDLADRLVPAEELWGASVLELEERLAAAPSVSPRFALVEQFLLRRLERHGKAGVEEAVRAVWNRRGSVRVAELCGELGLSERTLQRTFAAALGVPPRSYARLARFLHACSVLRKGGWNTLTEVGADCGYYDQAHFIGDFKALAGLTPGEFLAAPDVSFLELG